jgi:hypothetical protein
MMTDEQKKQINRAMRDRIEATLRGFNPSASDAAVEAAYRAILDAVQERQDSILAT